MQSVLFPAVPYHAGVLRIQCNANHEDAEIEGLIAAFAALTQAMTFPGPPARRRRPGTTTTGASSRGEVERRWADERGRILLIMLAAVIALTLGETALAKGMKQAARVGGDWTAQALAVARNGWIVAGVALLAVHLGLYLLALRRADLSFALPLTAASYPLSALMARFYLREDVGTARWFGTLLIAAGVAIVALGDARRDHLTRPVTPPGAVALGTDAPASPPSGRAGRRRA